MKLNILARNKFKNIENIFEYIETASQKESKPLQKEEIDKIIKDFENYFGIDNSADNNQVMAQNLNPNPNNQIITQNLEQAIGNFGNYQYQQPDSLRRPLPPIQTMFGYQQPNAPRQQLPSIQTIFDFMKQGGHSI